VAAVGPSLVNLAVSFPFLALLMLYYRIVPSLNILLLPFLILLTTLLAIGVGMWFSAINVKYRDVKFTMPFLVQVWMYISPVVYPTSVVPARFKLLYSLNPLSGIIDGFRSALFGRAIDLQSLGIASALTLITLIYASFRFRKMEKNFADII
jgi:lipopolysaccharide transport system permease protein